MSIHIRGWARIIVALAVFSIIWGTMEGTTARITQTLLPIDVYFLAIIIISLFAAPFIFLPVHGIGKETRFYSNLMKVCFVLGGIGFIMRLWMMCEISASIILLSAILATLGWVNAQKNARDSQKKQHTVNLIMQQRLHETFRLHQMNVGSIVKPNKTLGKVEYDALKAKLQSWKLNEQEVGKTRYPEYSSISWVANYYEFISIGLVNEDLDEGMIKDAFREMMCEYYCRVHEHIKDAQGRDDKGHIQKESYLFYTEIFYRWAREEQKEKCGPAPANLKEKMNKTACLIEVKKKTFKLRLFDMELTVKPVT